jgi:enoyl-CoA hydratase
MSKNVIVESVSNGTILVVKINRPEHRNAIDRDTADELHDIFVNFDEDNNQKVAILMGNGGNFCAGADLKAINNGNMHKIEGERGPLGPTRLFLSKPVIAVVSGYAVAGGLELACWCDMRICEESAIFGVFCRSKIICVNRIRVWCAID